jgi:hypothetical protein
MRHMHTSFIDPELADLSSRRLGRAKRHVALVVDDLASVEPPGVGGTRGVSEERDHRDSAMDTMKRQPVGSGSGRMVGWNVEPSPVAMQGRDLVVGDGAA